MRTVSNFIVIEGIDAAGKNTQAKLLAEKLKGKVISFPRYETPIGAMIKDVLHSDPRFNGYSSEQRHLLLQSLMRMDKRLAQNEISESPVPIIADRYWHSAWVYGQLDGLPPAALLQNDLREPMIAFLLDLSPTAAVERMVARGRPLDRYEAEHASFAKLAGLYRNLWGFGAVSGSPLYVTIDASGTPEAVHAAIMRYVRMVTPYLVPEEK
jgi:dTMP kinase